MKILTSLFLAIGLSALFPGCAGKPPVTGPNDTLIYFTLDVEELPGAFLKPVLNSADKSFTVGAAWDLGIRKKPKTALCYVAVPNDQAVYLAEIHEDDSGILTGRKTNMYMLTPQESPLKVAPTKIRAGVRYAGAYKFHLIKNGFFKGNNFTLERCTDCPSEKEDLEYLTNVGNAGATPELLENGYLNKLRLRLKSVSK